MKRDNRERDAMKALELHTLLSVKVWSRLIEVMRPEPELVNLYQRIRMTLDFLPLLEKLFSSTDLSEILSTKEAPNSPWNNFSLLSVTAIETSSRLSTPQRLANVLESIDMLYRAVAELDGLPETDLVVAACDSGSDKSFDLLGLAKVVSGVKELLIEAWDRLVFYRERKFDDHLTLICKSLPIIARIADLESEGKMTPQAAELLRRRVCDGLSKFIESGSMIPELQQHSINSPRKLLAPQQKFLAGPAPPTGQSTAGPPDTNQPSPKTRKSRSTRKQRTRNTDDSSPDQDEDN